jgi:hypothetical protein
MRDDVLAIPLDPLCRTIILDGVKEERWRILVGDDAPMLDRLVRENPEAAYEASFMEKLREETGWRLSR